MPKLLLTLLWAVAPLEQNGTMVPAYMDACIRKAVAGRSPEQLDERTRQALRQELLGDLGLDPLPEKTPLSAKVTGRLERDGYVIEKIVYETFPQFYATAYLYLPAKGEKPYPVVVSAIGHWSRKKLEPVVQARCIGLALYGFAVLCIDMPGMVGDNNDERNFPGSHCDWLLHMSSLPPIAAMVWDVVRGVDYLETRPEIDKQRIGLTGESGGGLTAMYAGVIENRIRCYVPVCYATSYEDNYNNGCFCNHVPGVMVIGDRSDVMALAAPKPILLIGADVDAEFPKAGTLRSHARLLKFYETAASGLPEQPGSDAAAPEDRARHAAELCQVFIGAGGHDYSKPMREQMYGFMLKHLMGKGDGGPAPELRDLPAKAGDRPLNVEDPALCNVRDDAPADVKARRGAVLCFPDGKPPADAKSLRQLAREKAQKLIESSTRAAGGVEPAKLREMLRAKLLAIYPVCERVPLDVQTDGGTGAPPATGGVGLLSADPAEQISGSYVSEPGLRIPFSLKRPAGGKLPARIMFSEAGLADTTAVAVDPATGARDERPYVEMRINGRGLGAIPGLEMKFAVYLGRPDVWMWAWDVSRAVDYLATRPEVDPAKIEVWGFGPAGGQVAYLAALLDSRISRAYGQRTLRSYLDAFDRDDLPRFALPHRILEVGDLALMRKALAEP
jgi:dienelactone hydrolase